jgi:hypothetical protein
VVRNTLIVAPTVALKEEEVGPAPTQLKLDKTVTPLTETDTEPPFQPSPHVSVLCMVCKHDCENKRDENRTKNPSSMFFIDCK